MNEEPVVIRQGSVPFEHSVFLRLIISRVVIADVTESGWYYPDQVIIASITEYTMA